MWVAKVSSFSNFCQVMRSQDEKYGRLFLFLLSWRKHVKCPGLRRCVVVSDTFNIFSSIWVFAVHDHRLHSFKFLR